MGFYKTGSVSPLLTTRIISLGDWKNVNASSDLEASQIVAQMEDDCIYVHGTILASVDLEPESKYLITKESEKFVNDNGDCFPRVEVLKNYKTFKEHAKTYVEHDQAPDKAKGKCLDVVARNMGDTVLLDVLFTIDKRYADLIHSVQKGYVNTLSMGCQTGYTMCSICGKIAHNDEEYCEHIANKKRQVIQGKDGHMRKVAEVCYDNTWIDVSLVSNPAFAGAVLRKIISKDEASRKVLANILERSITATALKEGVVMLKAASKQTTKAASVDQTSKEIAKILYSANGSITIKPISALNDVDMVREQEESEDYVPYHPIVNTTSDDDLSVDDAFAPIPWNDPHNFQNIPVLDEIETEPKTTLSKKWSCMSCHATKEQWLVKASIIDSQSNVVVCDKCGFVEEIDQEDREAVIEDAVNKVEGLILQKWTKDRIVEFVMDNYPEVYKDILEDFRMRGILV